MAGRHRVRVLIAGASVLAAAALFAPNLAADHQWGRYHWERSANPLLLDIGDNVSSAWTNHLTSAIGDWNLSAVLDLSKVPGGTSPSACSPTAGRVEVCNASYGLTGWLGVAQIWTSRGSHIVQATTKLNDTYFVQPAYNSPAWRQLVVCQEIGHTFGLDHQDEIFDNANLGTCMDYTDDPDGSLFEQLSNLSPNAHDYEELGIIYSHLDGAKTGGGGRKGGQPQISLLPPAALDHGQSNQSQNWGQLIRQSGRLALFDRDLGDGNHVFTFVILA